MNEASCAIPEGIKYLFVRKSVDLNFWHEAAGGGLTKVV
jgi:hypothetical protein